TATAGRNDAAALARGPMATLGSRARPPDSGSGTLAGEPITQAASISPAATSAAAPAWGRYVGNPGAKSTANGNPVCQVSTASAPARFPPPRSVTNAQRVGALSAWARVTSPSARSGSAGSAPGSPSATSAT